MPYRGPSFHNRNFCTVTYRFKRNSKRRRIVWYGLVTRYDPQSAQVVNLLLRTLRILLIAKLQYFLSFNITKWYHIDEFKKKATNYCVRFGHSLWSAISAKLYFPQSNLTVRIPYFSRDGERGLSRRLKLLELRTLRNDSTEPSQASYRVVTVPREPLVSIDPETNSLFLHGLSDEGTSSRSDTIVVLAKQERTNEAVLEITVKPLRVNATTINCADYVQDMCFWNTSRYRIYENQPIAMIGTFGPGIYTDLCPSFRVTGYKLLNGKDSLGPAPGGPGPRVAVQVQCVVWEEITGVQYAPIDTLRIDVLDQDDNPPMAQGNDSVDVSLGEFTAGDKLVDDNKLILKDADTEYSNRYNVVIHGDTHNAFNISYNTLPIEGSEGIPYTAIFMKIFAKTTLLPKSPYRVILQVKDESLIAGYGENTLNITVTFHGPEHRTTTTTVSPTSSGKQQSFSYPSGVKVARLAPRYTRVAKPSTEPQPSLIFSVHGSSAFAVTHKGGIVYVADEDLLRTESTNLVLKVKWSAKDRVVSSRTIKVNVSNVPASKVDACSHGKIGRMHSCANAETPEDCESSCGVASGFYSKGNFSGQCVWRWNKRSNQASIMSEYYPTCSPNLSHCPDNQCDELELLDRRICPQDCTEESDVHFAHINKNGRGIKSGLGTCACNDVLQCTCNVDRFRVRHENPARANKEGKEGKERKSQNEENEILISGARKASHGPCGPICMIGVIGGSFFVLIAIVGSLVTSRYRLAAKEARRDGKRRVDGVDSNVIGILSSDYVDRGDGSGNDGTTDDVCEIDTLRTDVVNYLERPCSDLVTKCDKVDKLHALWQESAAIFPEESVKLYVNDRSPSFPVGHYESPIKFRNTSVASNSDNDLVTPTSQRPAQSYIDMEGKKSSQTEAEIESEPEAEELLVFANGNDNGDQQARSN
ncbi:hypothetical protein E2986_12135 [Frieseomelitta varia]|uniref:RET cysteine rich domain-containing protein n=1 Tax=Frieseomelitta varia TaxID=561572 RepID=A0A833S0F3_9HYME|nr:hypothetical protein E2986_12135 [Frieseomelitta varia]